MAEVVIGPDETPTTVAQELLAQAEHPDHVVWTPRSNTPHGGVFTVPDDKIEDLVSRRENARQASEQATQARLDAASERDELASRTGLTPAELGFAASGPADLASFGQVGGESQPVDPLRSEDQRVLELQARIDGVAEAQDAQVARAQERADDADDEAADEDRTETGGPAKEVGAEDDDALAQEAANTRAAARKAARKSTAAKSADKTDKE
jgi:hypothetical protein